MAIIILLSMFWITTFVAVQNYHLRRKAEKRAQKSSNTLNFLSGREEKNNQLRKELENSEERIRSLLSENNQLRKELEATEAEKASKVVGGDSKPSERGSLNWELTVLKGGRSKVAK